MWFGVVMFSFRLPFYDGPIILSDDLKPLITVLWLLGISQAINLIDGLDGLAAGIVAIGAFAFFLYSQKLTDLGLLDSGNVGPLLAMIAVGVCVGFLPHNFNPARIMMGDGGALLLGLLLAVSTSVVGGRADSFSDEFIGQTYFFLAPLAIPLLILGVPILDTLFAIIRRATGRQGARHRRQGSPPPPPDEPRPRPPPQRRDPLDVDRAAVGVRALSDADRIEPDLPAVRDGRPGDRALHDPAPERARPTARGAAGGADRQPGRRGRARRGLARVRERAPSKRRASGVSDVVTDERAH